MRVVRASEEHRLQFDRFVSTCAAGNVLQSWAWGEFKAGCGWSVHRLLCLQGGAVTGTVSLLETLDEQGIRFLYAPRGPVVDWSARDSTVGDLVASIRSLAVERGAGCLVVDPAVVGGAASAQLTSLGFVADRTGKFGGIQPQCVWQVPLLTDPGRQWGMLSRSARRQVSRARRSGVTVTAGGMELVPDFARLIEHTERHHGIRLRSLTYFQLMGEVLAPSGQFTIVIARLGARPLAGALVAHQGHTAWDLYAGTDRTVDVGAGYLLTYDSMVWFCNRGYRLYDLGGVPVDGDDGLTAFKRKFGGNSVCYVGQYRYEFGGAGT